MDMSFMSKFLVQGRDAAELLNYLSANDVDGDPGVITYTQWLNAGGTLEADLTVTKLDDEKFWVVASDTAHGHAETWMRRHIADDAHAFVTDVTSAYAQINIQGPRSRELMQMVTSADMSNGVFPYRTAREIDIGFAARSASGSPTSVSSATSSTSRPSRPRTCTTASSKRVARSTSCTRD